MAGISPFLIGNTSTQSGSILQPAMLDDPGVYIYQSHAMLDRKHTSPEVENSSPPKKITGSRVWKGASSNHDFFRSKLDVKNLLNFVGVIYIFIDGSEILKTTWDGAKTL